MTEDSTSAELEAEQWAEAKSEIEELGKEHPLGVKVIDLSDGETVLSYNADESFTPASTYKLFTACGIVRRVESGDLPPEPGIAGMAYDNCFENMIVETMNECSEAWLGQIGRDQARLDAEETGASSTAFAYGALESSPSDLANYMERLYNGDLYTAENTEWFLGLLERQDYRDGIAGVFEPDHVVANKVGFVPGLNDVGIIYGPNDDYVVAIMSETEHDNWPLIREVSEIVGVPILGAGANPE